MSPPITRIPACTVSYCPTRLRSFKGDKADWHLCFVCQSNTVEHHDAGAGGMGGGRHHKQPENIVALCPKHHKAVTTHEYSDRIYDLPGKGRTYVYYDVRGNELCERALDYADPAAGEQLNSKLPSAASTPAVGSGRKQASKSGGATRRYEPTTEPPEPDTKTVEEGGAEGEAGSAAAVRAEEESALAESSDAVNVAAAPPASPLSSAGEARPARKVTRAVRVGASERVPVPESGSSPAEPSFFPVGDDYCRRGMWLLFLALRLQRMTTEAAFEIGDWVNEGENKLGEAAHQLFGVFSYWQIATWASVARRVPELGRHKELPLGHHQAVAALPEPKQREMLDAAAQGKWPLRTLREAVSGPSEPKERHECPSCGADHVVRVAYTGKAT